MEVIWDALKSGAGSVIDFFTGLLDTILQTVTGIAQAIGEIVAQVTDSVGSLFGSGEAGNVVREFFGLPQRAAGGPVTGNEPYIVGERGPELFVPNMSGTIIPNNALSGTLGGSTSISINIPQVVVRETADIEKLSQQLARDIPYYMARATI